MMRSLFSGVSGLRNHQIRMDVIGNNISNVNTTGYKSSRVTFEEGFAQILQGASRPPGGSSDVSGGVNPVQVGLGMNVYYAAPGIEKERLAAVEALFNASGEALAVNSEDAIDAATAISGSGPAYVFYVAEHWMSRAQALGFSAEEAQKLVQQTLIGATTLWKTQDVAVGTLREQVTSKGGTTAAALETFEAASVGAGLREGIEKAYQRAKELGR